MKNILYRVPRVGVSPEFLARAWALGVTYGEERADAAHSLAHLLASKKWAWALASDQTFRHLAYAGPVYYADFMSDGDWAVLVEIFGPQSGDLVSHLTRYMQEWRRATAALEPGLPTEDFREMALAHRWYDATATQRHQLARDFLALAKSEPQSPADWLLPRLELPWEHPQKGPTP